MYILFPSDWFFRVVLLTCVLNLLLRCVFGNGLVVLMGGASFSTFVVHGYCHISCYDDFLWCGYLGGGVSLTV